MKVAYFAESAADEAALTIFTEAILSRKTTPVVHAGLRHRGWPAARDALPAVLRELHYHTDAEDSSWWWIRTGLLHTWQSMIQQTCRNRNAACASYAAL